ncbi:MAG: hypothetical protein KA401_00545 [Anaerolineae bacterium]|nr:hypothetical protein [Chloroflexota bacterium]MBP6297805.1 hypothetical protein [Anaerolineae bacterium]
MEQRSGLTRWEYIIMEATINYGGSKFAFNGELNNQFKNMELHVVLNQMGTVGWDLINVQTVNANTTIYTFKRPLRAAPQSLQQAADKSGA